MTITTYATNPVVLTMIISLKIMTSATKLKRLWSTSFPYILQEVKVERRVKVGNGKMSKQEERKQRKRRKREEERKNPVTLWCIDGSACVSVVVVVVGGQGVYVKASVVNRVHLRKGLLDVSLTVSMAKNFSWS